MQALSEAWGNYVDSTITKLRRKSFRARSTTSQMEMSAGNEMPKVLGAVDLTFLGIGGIIGSGVFVLTGVAAKQDAGCAAEELWVVIFLWHTLERQTCTCLSHIAVSGPWQGYTVLKEQTPAQGGCAKGASAGMSAYRSVACRTPAIVAGAARHAAFARWSPLTANSSDK